MNPVKWIATIVGVIALVIMIIRIWRYVLNIISYKRKGEDIDNDMILGLITLCVGFVVGAGLLLNAVLRELGIW